MNVSYHVPDDTKPLPTIILIDHKWGRVVFTCGWITTKVSIQMQQFLSFQNLGIKRIKIVFYTQRESIFC